MWESSGGTPDGGSAQRRCTPAGSPCSNTRNNPPHLCRLLVSIPSAEYSRRSHPSRSILCAHIRAAHASGNPRRNEFQQQRCRKEGDTTSARAGYVYIRWLPGRESAIAARGNKGMGGSVLEQVCGHPLHFSACATAKLGTRGASATRHFSFRTPFPPSSCTLFFLVGRTERTGPRKTKRRCRRTRGQQTFPYKVLIYRKVVCFPVAEKH
jgi:hypothetical protein